MRKVEIRLTKARPICGEVHPAGTVLLKGTAPDDVPSERIRLALFRDDADLFDVTASEKDPQQQPGS